MPAAAVPVLMYHHVSPNPGLVTVSPQTFRAQMSWLARHGYTALSSNQFAAFLAGQSVAEKSVLITFDDGYLDNYLHAFPALRDHGLRAVIFAVTGWVSDGTPRSEAECPAHSECMRRIESGAADSVMLRWSEIEQMENDGICEIHSHTHTHTRWDRQIADPAERYGALLADLVASRDALQKKLGKTSQHLCWPQGYYDAQYQSVAREAGFTHLYTVRKGVNTPRTAPAEINRIVVKDKPGMWFASRLWTYRHAGLGALYTKLRGD